MRTDKTAEISVRYLLDGEFCRFWSLYKRAVREEALPFAHVPSDIDDISAAAAAERYQDSLIFGCFHEDDLIGIARVDRRLPKKLAHKAELCSVYIVPQFRGRGLGKRFLREIIKNVGANIEFLRLYANIDNTAAISLYGKIGFLIYATENNAKKIDGIYIDEVVMELDLRSESAR